MTPSPSSEVVRAARGSAADGAMKRAYVRRMFAAVAPRRARGGGRAPAPLSRPRVRRRARGLRGAQPDGPRRRAAGDGARPQAGRALRGARVRDAALRAAARGLSVLLSPGAPGDRARGV